ncbi:MAG: AAA family ATPase [Candidimonas sp.]
MSKKIVFIGTAGSGKSTLAAEVFFKLKQQHLNVEHISEFIRNDIHRHGPMTSIWEQYRTRQHQKDIEDAVPECTDYIVIDSGTLTPYFYACLYVNNEDSRQRLVLSDMYRYLIDDLMTKRYDYIFFLPVTLTKSSNPMLLEDGTRYQTEKENDILDRHMRMLFVDLNLAKNITILDCPLEQRIDQVISTLGLK